MQLSRTLHRRLHGLIDDALSSNPRTTLIATRVLASEIRWIRERTVTISRRTHWSRRHSERVLAVGDDIIPRSSPPHSGRPGVLQPHRFFNSFS
jgi:hypothetical protein